MDKYYEGCCYCIICGNPIPEGRMICPTCEEYLIKNNEKNTDENFDYNYTL